MVAINDNVIIARLASAPNERLTPEAAAGLLTVSFSRRDVDRMNELAALAREGDMSKEQQAELESYNRVSHLLAMIHSSARIALKVTNGPRRD